MNLNEIENGFGFEEGWFLVGVGSCFVRWGMRISRKNTKAHGSPRASDVKIYFGQA